MWSRFGKTGVRAGNCITDGDRKGLGFQIIRLIRILLGRRCDFDLHCVGVTAEDVFLCNNHCGNRVLHPNTGIGILLTVVGVLNSSEALFGRETMVNVYCHLVLAERRVIQIDHDFFAAGDHRPVFGRRDSNQALALADCENGKPQYADSGALQKLR